MRPTASLIATTAFLAFSSGAIAAPEAAVEAPDALLKRVFTEMTDAVKAAPRMRKGDRRALAGLVEARLLSHLDSYRMTALAVGRFWRQATPDQQRRLQSEFRDLVVHAYADALAVAADGAPVFDQVRLAPQDTEAEVRSRVAVAGGAPRVFAYRLESVPRVGWKIYDINVTGEWLVEAVRPRFAAEISKGGIDALVAMLGERNRQWKHGASAPVTSEPGR